VTGQADWWISWTTERIGTWSSLPGFGFKLADRLRTQRPEQRRQVFCNGCPEYVKVDVEIMVDEPIPHVCGGGPCHVGLVSLVSELTCLAAAPAPTISTSLVNANRRSSS